MTTRHVPLKVGALVTAGVLLPMGCSSAPQSPPEVAWQATSNGTKTIGWAHEPPMSIDTSKKYTMTLKTSQGDVVIALNTAKAPHAVNSFNFLAAHKYFDDTHCHRLTTLTIYILQCGDPTGHGTAGPPDYQFQDENLAGATYPTGTVAMANSGPNTNGSQFFLVYQDTQLPPTSTPFGTVVSGIDVLRKVAAAGTANGTGDGPPEEPAVLNSVTVTAS